MSKHKVSYQGTSETKGKDYQITNCLVGTKFTVNVYEAVIYCRIQDDLPRCISFICSFEKNLWRSSLQKTSKKKDKRSL